MERRRLEGEKNLTCVDKKKSRHSERKDDRWEKRRTIPVPKRKQQQLTHIDGIIQSCWMAWHGGPLCRIALVMCSPVFICLTGRIVATCFLG